MKKNKTIAYALAATLLVGGTFAGTKALYSAQETADTGLIIETGKLDLEISNEGWWATQPGSETGYTQLNAKNFVNAKPGDVFMTEYTVTNTGTLAQKLQASGGEALENAPEGLIVNPSHNNSLDNKVLKPGESDTFMILVKIDENVEDQEIKFQLGEHISPIVIDADQLPANKTIE